MTYHILLAEGCVRRHEVGIDLIKMFLLNRVANLGTIIPLFFTELACQTAL